MACDPLQPASCVATAVATGADAAAGAVSNAFAETIRDGATWIVRTTVAWWIDVPAIDLERSPVATIRGQVLGIAVAVAVAGVIWQGLLMAVSRRPEPALVVGRGLFTLALWTAVGVAGPAAALRAGDAFSGWVLDQAADGQTTARLVALAQLTQVSAPGAVIVLGLFMMLAGLAQAVLMMFREASVVVLAGVVVLAAAGSMTGATRPWLPRVLGWLLALICYKPAAALVYATALTLVGDSTDVRSFFVGVTMMLLAIVALPALMKLFTWTTGSLGGGGGGLAALAGATAAALHAGASLSYYRSRSLQEHSEQLRVDLGPNGGPPTGPPSGPPPSGPGPSGPGSTGSRPGSPGSSGPGQGRPGSGGPPPSPASPVTPAGGAAPTSSPTAGAGTATGTAGAAGAAQATSPWLLAAAALTEAARRAKDAGQGAADSMTPKDQP